jgi:hypothetical protein
MDSSGVMYKMVHYFTDPVLYIYLSHDEWGLGFNIAGMGILYCRVDGSRTKTGIGAGIYGYGKWRKPVCLAIHHQCLDYIFQKGIYSGEYK